MMQINLREFANLTEEQALRWRGFRFACEVTDDAGEKILSDTFAMLLTWQGLIIHRLYNHVPYSVKECIPSNKGPGNSEVVYNDKTLAIPINYTLQEVMPNINDPVENDFIKRWCYIWQTKLNNLLVVMSETSVISATAESVAELMEDEGIADIRNKVLRREISIDEGEDLFSVYIKEAETLNHNTMALMARTGGVSINQAYQTAIIRGSVFDLNNTILPNPVMSNYGSGITNLADALGDSKGSGKSLISNGKGLKDSEWFHRKIHIFTAPLHSIDHMSDCGSTELVPIKVVSTEMAVAMLGKFRMMDDGKLQMIDHKTVKQIKTGETILFRSEAFCANGKDGKPCGKCYGAMKSAIPYNVMMKKDANVGMYSGTTICNPLGQKMLSTKHFIRNAVTKNFVPHQRDRDIIWSNGDEIFLNGDLCKEGTRLVLRSSIVKDLSDLRSLDVLDEVSLDKLPYFSEVTFQYEVEDIMVGGKTVQQHSAQTSVSSRHARFSMGFLRYIMENSWTVQDKRFISVDLNKWNSAEPMFVLPYTREDLDAHRSRVENFLTFNKRNTAWRKQVVTPKIFGEVMSEFWTLINAETKGINMIHVETILTCALTRDPNNLSYKLANGIGEKYFTSFISCIDNRGSGGLMIFERQQNVMNNARTFNIKDRQGSPLECFLQLGVS
jgi:hypothetical protein